MEKLIVLFVILSLAQTEARAQENKIIIQENVNLRTEENATSQIVSKLPQLVKVTLLSKGKSEVINDISDYWYKVKTDKNQVGYVFGHFTSLKIEGQKKVIATFTDCSMGDLYHIEFNNGAYDFGAAQNNLGEYELCGEDDMGDPTGNPEYINKKFEIIINDLVAKVCCDPSCEEVCIEKVPTIVEIEMIK